MENLAPVFIYVVVGVIGWFTKTLWDADRSLREDLSKLKEDMPRNFVLREDYRSDMAEIRDLLREIRAMLDGKADK